MWESWSGVENGPPYHPYADSDEVARV